MSSWRSRETGLSMAPTTKLKSLSREEVVSEGVSDCRRSVNW
jgi:hypothetical protein